jgi:hypothetical protein
MAIPTNLPFGLTDVIVEVFGSAVVGKSLRDCFSSAIPSAFDPVYAGDKDRLSNFRGYGAIVYYSQEIAAYYTKNSCGAGYYGSLVYVEIAQGEYTSMISQGDADSAAESAAQEYANTNGTCTPYNNNVPEVSALVFYSMESTTAEVETTANENGGGPITERGVCYSTTNDTPTISDSKAMATILPATNTVLISGLTPNTGYYWRAYASNANGTAYYPDEGFYYGTQ